MSCSAASAAGAQGRPSGQGQRPAPLIAPPATPAAPVDAWSEARLPTLATPEQAASRPRLERAETSSGGFLSIAAVGVTRKVRDMEGEVGSGLRLHVERWTRWRSFGVAGFAELGVARAGGIVELPLLIGARLYSGDWFIGPQAGLNLIGGDIDEAASAWPIWKERQTQAKYLIGGLQSGYSRDSWELGYSVHVEVDPKGKITEEGVKYSTRSTEHVVFIGWKL